jgi:hypothetical protein
MAGIPSVGAALSNTRLQAEFSARVAKLQLNVAEQQGAQAIQLIQAASVDSGQNLDISI